MLPIVSSRSLNNLAFTPPKTAKGRDGLTLTWLTIMSSDAARILNGFATWSIVQKSAS